MSFKILALKSIISTTNVQDVTLHWTSSWMRLMSQNPVNPLGTLLLGHGKDLHHLSEPLPSGSDYSLFLIGYMV
jgi:hypothetical protein